MLDILYNLRQGVNLILSLFQVLFIFFLEFLHTIGFDNLVYLRVQVNLVSYSLEFVSNLGMMLALNNELSYIVNVHLQVTNGLHKPLLGIIDTAFGNSWQQKLNVIVKLFRRRLQFSFNLFTVKLEHANISSCGQVGLEMALEILEELHHLTDGFYRVFQLFICQAFNVELFVTPVNFKNGLEAFQEMLSFVIRHGHEIVYAFFLSFENIGVVDPSNRIQSQDFLFVPRITYNVVPLFKHVSKLFKGGALTPTGKALNFLKAALEIINNFGLEFLFVGLKFNPEILNIRQRLLVKLSRGYSFGFAVGFGLFFFLIASLFFLEIHMRKQVVIVILTRATWVRCKVVNWLFNDL